MRDREDSAAAKKARGRAATLGGAVFLVLTGGTLLGGGRACLALHGEATDLALARLRACPQAHELLGEDIGWSASGCTTYHSSVGGNPADEGCSSSGTFRARVSGTKARGLYIFSTSAETGKHEMFRSGSLSVGGRSVAIDATKPCK